MLQVLAKLALSLRVQAIVLFRIGQSAHRLSPALGAIVKYVNQVLTGADISLEASIGPGFVLYHPAGVVIGPNCILGKRCTIMQGVTVGGGPNGSGDWPRLGEGVYVGPGAKIIGGIETLRVMNEVEAHMDGRVVEILVQPGQPVEYGQRLIALAPETH